MSTDEPMVPGDGQTFAGPTNLRRRRIIAAVLIVIIAALISEILFVVMSARSYYVIQPGSAPFVSDQPTCKATGGGSFALPDGKPCVRLVLPADQASNTDDSIMMVDVLVGQATPWQYFLHQVGLLHSVENGSVLVPNEAILGTAPASQFSCQNTQEMNSATNFASIAALRRLGYKVTETDLGAQLVQVNAGTPAAAAGLECNDLVVAVDGKAVHTADQFVSAVHGFAPGDQVHVTVDRIVKRKTQTLDLVARLEGTPAIGGQPANPKEAFLGVALETRSTYKFPFAVNFEVGQIGGPSAGLAMTLALIDSLTHGQLTGGLRIAATGTMDPDGNVGDVGGVAQKTIAVRDAGAKVFFVPVQELSTAKSEAGSMKIYAVSTLTQALNDLEALGGHVPPPPSGQNGPPSGQNGAG